MDNFKERDEVDPFFYDPDAEAEYRSAQYDILEDQLREEAALQQRIELNDNARIVYDHLDQTLAIESGNSIIYLSVAEAALLCNAIEDIFET